MYRYATQGEHSHVSGHFALGHSAVQILNQEQGTNQQYTIDQNQIQPIPNVDSKNIQLVAMIPQNYALVAPTQGTTFMYPVLDNNNDQNYQQLQNNDNNPEPSPSPQTPKLEYSGITKLVENTQNLVTSKDVLDINQSVDDYQNNNLFKPAGIEDQFNAASNGQKQAVKLVESNNEFTSPIVVNEENSIVYSSTESIPKEVSIFPSSYDYRQTQAERQSKQINVQILDNNNGQYLKETTFEKDSTTEAPSRIFLKNFKSKLKSQGGIQSTTATSSTQTTTTQTYAQEFISVTPGPISNKFLAPIQAGLRISNEGKPIEDCLDGHSQNGHKTIVEVQKSVSIKNILINEERGKEQSIPVFGARFVPKPQKIIKQNVYIDRPYPVQVDRIVEKQIPYQVPVHIQKETKIHVPVDRIVEKPVPYPVQVEKIVDRPYPVDRIVEKHVPVPVEIQKQVLVPYTVEKIVEKPIHHTHYVDRPYSVTKTVHQQVQVPYPVEKIVKQYVDRPYPVEKQVNVPYPVEKIVEKQIPVDRVVEKYVDRPVPYPVTVEKIVNRPYPVEKVVEKIIDRPVEVEKIVEKEVKVPYPVQQVVEKIVDRPVEVEKVIEKKVHVPYPVEVNKYIDRPYPVDRVVEKQVPVPYPVDKYIDRPVEVEKIVEKTVQVPVDRIVEKYVNVPVHIPVEKIVDRPYAVEKIVEKIVDRPVAVQVQVPVPVHIPYAVHVPVHVPYEVEKEVKVPYPVPYAVHVPYVPSKPQHHTIIKTTTTNEYPGKHLFNSLKQKHTTKHLVLQDLPFFHNDGNSIYSDSHESSKSYGQQYHASTILKPVNVPVPQNHIHYTNPKPVYGVPQFSSHPSKYQNHQTYAGNYDYQSNIYRDDYLGPPPIFIQRHFSSGGSGWLNSKSTDGSNGSQKYRRNSNFAKNLRWEYGFKPPLIPSIEIDEHGNPIEREQNT